VRPGGIIKATTSRRRGQRGPAAPENWEIAAVYQ
jgi:hypothetical protein